MSFYRRLLANHPLANIAFVVVLALGTLAYLTMPREQDPEINFNWVVITTVLPGASPEDVEKRVTKPLEDAIKGVADVRFSMSSSRENVSNILVRFREIPERTFDKRVNDLRRDIQNKAASELPAEAKDPQVLEITTSNGFPTALVVVKGGANDEVLRRQAKLLRDDFERMTGVDQVFATGLADPELRIEYDSAALANRGLTGTDVADAAFAWFRDTFAGKIETQTHEGRDAWLVRVVGQHADPERIAQIPVGKGRHQTPLDSVASVARARGEPTSLASHAGQAAVMLAITKKSKINTLDLIERTQAFIAEKNVQLAATGISLQLVDDQTHATRESISIMETNAVVGLLVVLAMCWLFLGTRIAVLVGLGLPFSLAGTFAVLGALGYTVNISVLLGVVIALGMLVDDAVVVVEAIYFKMQRGLDALTASLDAMREVFAPVTSSVLTTMAAFLPLMLLPGIVGKFMFVIPFIVTLALAISLIEAYWILPVHVVSVGGRPAADDWRARFNHLLRVKYARALIAIMRRPRVSLAAAGVLFACAVAAVASGVVRVQFFAFDPMRIFYVNIDMPAGAPLEISLAEATKLEAQVREKLPASEIRNSMAYAGIKFTDTEPLYGDAYGQVVVSLQPNAEGGRSVSEIVAALRPQIEALPTVGKVSFTLLSGGPPVTKPIRVRVRGDDPLELRAAADALKTIVKDVPGTHDVTDDEIPGRPQLVLELDREALRAAGLDAARVARLVRLAVDGEIIAQTRDLGEKIELRVRAHRKEDSVGHDILNLLDDPLALPDAAGAAGAQTTLGALVRAETKTGPGVIKHYNLMRSITVEADLDKNITDTVAADRLIQQAWPLVAAQFPNVSLDFSGEMEDIRESLDAMKVLFLLGVGLIYLILAAQFKSYWQPLLILVTVPLAFTGVAFGLALSRNPLSLYTLYGVIALTGIAVNSAIVLIDAANERMKAGMSVLHAAVYAARRRLVPILITSVTTIGGLFSLAFGLAGSSLLWGPVAQSIVWGLTFSTVLTLFVIPLLYWMAMGRRKVSS